MYVEHELNRFRAVSFSIRLELSHNLVYTSHIGLYQVFNSLGGNLGFGNRFLIFDVHLYRCTSKSLPESVPSCCPSYILPHHPSRYIIYMRGSYLDAAKGSSGKEEAKIDVEELENGPLSYADGCVIDDDYDLSYALALSLQEEENAKSMALREEELAVAAKRGQNQGNVKLYRPGDVVRHNSVVSKNLNAVT